MDLSKRKISIVFFLNDDLKSKKKDGEVFLYRLYARVTYNLRNTKFPISNRWYLKEEEDNLNKNPEIIKLKSIITKIVRHEVLTQGESYKIAGFGKRLETYSSSLGLAFEWVFLRELEMNVGKTMPYLAYLEWQKKPFGEKIKEGVNSLKEKDLEQIRPLGWIYGVFTTFDFSINIYTWLFLKEREIVISKFKQLGKELLDNNEVGLALGCISMAGFDDMKSINRLVSYIDQFCESLVRVGYSDKAINTGAEFDLEEIRTKINM